MEDIEKDNGENEHSEVEEMFDELTVDPYDTILWSVSKRKFIKNFMNNSLPHKPFEDLEYKTEEDVCLEKANKKKR